MAECLACLWGNYSITKYVMSEDIDNIQDPDIT